MDHIGIIELSIFVVATFAASFVAGLAGFAFGIVAAAAWLYVLPPAQSAALIAAYGLVVQGFAVWKLRHALRPPRLVPFVIGAAFGVPFGIALLSVTPGASVRMGTGWVLVLFSVYNLLQPKLPRVEHAGPLADGGVGFLSGVLGGATGLAGILAVVWCLLRGWPKDEQRAVFQPLGVFIFALTAAGLGATGTLTSGVVALFGLGLPFVLAGTWLGLKAFGKINEATFRRVVLALLLISGLFLILS